MTSQNDFCREVDCIFKGEHYLVRDNGEVFRYSHPGRRESKYDNVWTFGNPDEKTGYMMIASIRVHSIVANAFHGVPPTGEHIVHHIDTNRRNNRPENLLWVTKLENVLLDPITSKKIALVCGSVEAFLADPSKFRDKFQQPNVKWMCNVSTQEAKISYERLLAWAKSDKRPGGGSLGKWIFDPTILRKHDTIICNVPENLMSKTFNAAQSNWSVPSEFPCCPEEYVDDPLKVYSEKLKPGTVFCRNNVYSSLVLKCALAENDQSLYVISESIEGKKPIKPWALAKITFENGLFMHTNLHNFFTLEGAEKRFCLVQGLEWSGKDSIDDYC